MNGRRIPSAPIIKTPDVDGTMLAAEILTIHPNVSVIFMSGYGPKTNATETIGTGRLSAARRTAVTLSI